MALLKWREKKRLVRSNVGELLDMNDKVVGEIRSKDYAALCPVICAAEDQMKEAQEKRRRSMILVETVAEFFMSRKDPGAAAGAQADRYRRMKQRMLEAVSGDDRLTALVNKMM